MPITSSLPASPTLVGDIHAEDYLAVAPRLSARPFWFRPLLWCGGLIAVVAAFLVTVLTSDLDHLRLVLPVLGLAVCTAVIAADLVRAALQTAYRWHFIRHAVVPNQGRGTSTIVGTDLHFTGTMYHATIPIAGIREVISCRGTTLLVFSNVPGFVIPRRVIAGELGPFLARLRELMASRTPDAPAHRAD